MSGCSGGGGYWQAVLADDEDRLSFFSSSSGTCPHALMTSLLRHTASEKHQRLTRQFWVRAKVILWPTDLYKRAPHSVCCFPFTLHLSSLYLVFHFFFFFFFFLFSFFSLQLSIQQVLTEDQATYTASVRLWAQSYSLSECCFQIHVSFRRHFLSVF